MAFLQDQRPALQAIEVLSLAALYFHSIDMRSAAYQYVRHHPAASSQIEMPILAREMQIGQPPRLALHDGFHRRMPDGLGPGLMALCGTMWWGAYILDQEISTSLECPSAIPQGDITTPLPDALSSRVSGKALALYTRLSWLVSIVSSWTEFPMITPSYVLITLFHHHVRSYGSLIILRF